MVLFSKAFFFCLPQLLSMVLLTSFQKKSMFCWRKVNIGFNLSEATLAAFANCLFLILPRLYIKENSLLKRIQLNTQRCTQKLNLYWYAWRNNLRLSERDKVAVSILFIQQKIEKRLDIYLFLKCSFIEKLFVNSKRCMEMCRRMPIITVIRKIKYNCPFIRHTYFEFNIWILFSDVLKH